MNKTIIRSLLGAVIVIILFLIFSKTRSPFGKDNSSFASEPEKEITRIEFTDGKQKLTLEKAGDNWLLNGKIETRKSSIQFIIRILKEIRIKSPVSSELFESEITAKGIIPVKVKVYERRKLLRSFLVYKSRSNKYGNIMKTREGAKPFIVYLPGYEDDIGSAFTLKELFWQPYSIFNLLPSEIESIDFENVTDPANSFLILNKNHHYIVSDKVRDLTGWDSARVTRYLSYFTRIPFESWAFEIGEEEQKNIENQQPLYRITVTSTGGKKTILTLWERMTQENNQTKEDSDRLLGKTQERNELFVIRYFDIDPILKKRSYFFP
jgi:hypothetical protein